MKGNSYSNVTVFKTCKLEWNHLLLTGPKKNQRWGKKFGMFMFIADNSIFKSIMQYFFSQINSAEGVLPNDEFFLKKIHFTVFKISLKMQI